MKKHTVKTFISSALSHISPRSYMALSYLYNRRRIPNFNRPRDLSEKLIKSILNGDMEKYADLADKFKVRKFVEGKGLEHILPKLFGTWTDVSEINFDLLPDEFVLKSNNGCGYNIFCRNKKDFDIASSIAQLNNWLHANYNPVESHYKMIEPRILCEEFISDETAAFPIDYKFMCFHGKPHCILVCTDRANGFKLTTMDVNWNRLEYLTSAYFHNCVTARPRNLELMLEYAAKLAEDFEFVRVDLYDTGEKVFFGELTFTPQKGIVSYFSNRAAKIMGELLENETKIVGVSSLGN